MKLRSGRVLYFERKKKVLFWKCLFYHNDRSNTSIEAHQMCSPRQSHKTCADDFIYKNFGKTWRKLEKVRKELFKMGYKGIGGTPVYLPNNGQNQCDEFMQKKFFLYEIFFPRNVLVFSQIRTKF